MEVNIGYVFKNKKLLKGALTHSSLRAHSSSNVPDFEKLEFLGDRVLGLVISKSLYSNEKSNQNEGIMACKLASLVSAKTCSEIAISIGMHKCLKTSNDAVLSSNESVMADAMEALIGAIFLDSNFEIANERVLAFWKDKLLQQDFDNPKTELQEMTQKINKQVPEYTVISKSGDAHCPTFVIKLTALDMETIGMGQSKKVAESEAASKMLRLLRDRKKI
jgi:ribonuclease-3